MLEFLLGDSAQELSVQSIGVNGRPLPLFAGTLRIDDGSIATLHGLRIRPRAPGMAIVSVNVGDHSKRIVVTVYKRVHRLDSIRPNEPVAVPVQVASGEMRRWSIPAGTYLFSVLPARPGHPKPRLAVQGANCVRGALSGNVSFWCLAPSGASVIVYQPFRASDTAAVMGHLTVRRVDDMPVMP
jgi:hypothetical protein